MPEGLATSGIQELTSLDVLSTQGSATNGLESPIRGFRFIAEFDGLGTASFKSVEGFSSEVEAVDYREGGFGYLTKRKLPGLVTYGEITLSKGLYSNVHLYQFFNDYLEGNEFNPVNGKISVFNNAGDIKASWSIINAWPSSYSSSGLSAEDSAIIVEELKLVHEGIKRDTGV